MKSFRDFYRIFAIDWVITGYLGLVEGIFPHDTCRFELSELTVVSLDGLILGCKTSQGKNFRANAKLCTQKSYCFSNIP